MAKDKKAQLFISRPKDRSLEAYKNWIKAAVDKVNPGGEDLTNQEWEALWKEFWSKSKPEPQPTNESPT